MAGRGGGVRQERAWSVLDWLQPDLMGGLWSVNCTEELDHLEAMGLMFYINMLAVIGCGVVEQTLTHPSVCLSFTLTPGVWAFFSPHQAILYGTRWVSCSSVQF